MTFHRLLFIVACSVGGFALTGASGSLVTGRYGLAVFYILVCAGCLYLLSVYGPRTEWF